ncbi:shikimate kinase [Candidatus Micrarchaeota archaeon]|nr:shikimate kinase [Candidatus Micrarchaeota archaeon]
MNVVLIGFMGSGKTSVGKALARKKEMDFLDMDEEIEKQEGRKISDIVNENGMDFFRDKESVLLEEISRKNPENTVVATGGGVILSQENRAILKKLGRVVWLDVSPLHAHERTRNDDNRPLLNHPNRRAVIEELLRKRKPFYQEAELHIQVDGKTPEQVAKEIEGKL